MQTYLLSTGETLTLREATLEDAAAIIAYTNQVATESEMITISPGEFDLTIEQQKSTIEKRHRSYNQIFLIGIIDDTIVSLSDISASNRKRIKHIGNLGISTLKAYWGKGIGRKAMTYLLKWADKSGIISKINLTVREDNMRAIKLYETLGFEIEGKQRDGLQTNTEMKDVYIMGRIRP